MFEVPNIYCNVNALFFFFTAGTFIVCGVLHPGELITLLQGLVYYVAIPTMYMILMLYAVCNLNVISWGTRETKQETKPKTPSNSSVAAEGESVGLICGFVTRVLKMFGINRSCVVDANCCRGCCDCCRPLVIIDPQVINNTMGSIAIVGHQAMTESSTEDKGGTQLLLVVV